jgi:hypothetical protein
MAIEYFMLMQFEVYDKVKSVTWNGKSRHVQSGAVDNSIHLYYLTIAQLC